MEERGMNERIKKLRKVSLDTRAGIFLAEDALFCQKMAPVPAKRNGTRRKMQKFQIGTSIFPGFVI